jgi:hypothetical protein
VHWAALFICNIYVVYKLLIPFQFFCILYSIFYVMQVSHVEDIERVTNILKDYGFCPPGEIIEAKNLYLLFVLLCIIIKSKVHGRSLLNLFEGAI